MKHVLVSLGLLAVLLSACSDSTCVEVTHPPVTDPDTPLVIGGTYGDALATVVGERSGTLRWLESSAHVRGFPPPGEARITVTIREPSMAEQVDLEREGREGLYPERHICPDQLEAELQIDLRSDDGVLDATVLASASFDSPGSAMVVANVTEQDLGALVFDPIDPDASLRLVLTYRAEDISEGVLRLSSGGSDDPSSGAGMTVDLAAWTLE